MSFEGAGERCLRSVADLGSNLADACRSGAQMVRGLSRLDSLCAGMDIVFPGHGAAAAPDQLISAQRAYLLTLAAHVKDLANGRSELTADQKKELERRMIEYLPSAGLTFLVGMNADPIARELNGSR